MRVIERCTVRATARLVLSLTFVTLSVTAQQRVEDVRQGTNTSVAISPDGASLVTDLLGGLWRLPANGGGAVPLIEPGNGVSQPQFAPEGDRVVFERFIENQWDLWELDLATGEARALTETPSDERHPELTADGTELLFASNRTGRFALWSMGLASGALRQLNDEPGDSVYPAVSEDGQIVYVNRDGRGSTLRRLDRGAAGTILLESSARLSAPSWRPGGGVILYQERRAAEPARLRMLLLSGEPVVKTLTQDEDLFEGRPAWLSRGEYLYTADGQIWRRTVAGFARQPVHLFAAVTVDVLDSEPREDVIALGSEPRAATLADVGSDDEQQLIVFSALGDLWRAGRRGAERLTDDVWVDVDPSVYPDGRGVVFASDRGGQLSLWQWRAEDGTLLPLTHGPGRAHSPAIGPDGRLIAYVETDGLGSWSESRLALLDVAGGTGTSVLGGPLYDVGRPRWGRVGVEPRILLDARPDHPTAARRTLSFDVGGNALPADEPGLSRARETVLESPEPPRWQPAMSDDRYVIEAGRVFDGVRNGYLRHVDLHIEGGRIAAVVGRGVRPAAGRVIDARDATVMPGLIDTHVHQHALAGERLGRVWLAYGVTTVRELSSEPDEAMARAEAWASDRLPGPRLLVSASNVASLDPDRIEDSRLGVGFAHEIAWQARQLGFPELPRGQLLAALAGHPTRPVMALRVSPALESYQDTLGLTLGSRRFVSTGLAASLGRLPRPPDSSYIQLFGSESRPDYEAQGPESSELARLGGTLARLARSGGNLVLASEAPVVPFGFGVHAELEALASAGLSNDQVLRIATAQGARALGLDTLLGTIEPGKLADLVIVDGDPLARIRDTSRVEAVVLGGRWLDRNALLNGP